MDILFYGNGGSGNHGCEAIYRGSAALLCEPFSVLSESMEEDCLYGLDSLCQIQEATSPVKWNMAFLKAYLRLKLLGDYAAMDALPYLPQIAENAKDARIALSVGGDNYCYGNTSFYAHLNQAYQKAGYKTVLWGCSVEPTAVCGDTAKDLARYDAIVARESITYEALKAVNPNTVLAPDPAFFMEPQLCALDKRLESGNVIGINVSPMIISNESSQGITVKNYLTLIQTILDETDAYIALIPHVVWERNDDRTILRQLYEKFGQNERLILVEDHNAPELKYIISKCRFFVGARTHATIAAYSTCVPTLVVGYSVKARGIARDLFGTEEGYVLPVQELNQAADLTEAFRVLYAREAELHAHLSNIMPSYKKRGHDAVVAIAKLRG